MLKKRNIIRTTAIVAICSLSMVACKGGRAKINLSKSEEIQQELIDLDAQDHAPAKLQQLQSLISDANSRLAEGSNAEAFDLSKQARELAETTLVEVEAAEARNTWDEAQNMIVVGDTNNISNRAPNIYENIRALNSEGEQARAESSYRDVIRISREIIQEVETGISPVRTEAERAKIAAENNLRELKNAEALKYDPVSVVNVDDAISNGDAMFNDRSDFIAAKTAYDEAFNIAEDGMINVQRAKAEENIDTLEETLAVAFEEGAPRFLTDRYNGLIEDFRTAIVDFNNGYYRRVNNASEQLISRALVLKVDTKRAASDDRISQMRNTIDDLVEAGVNQYLAGRTQPLEDVLSQARTVREGNREADFDNIRNLFQDFQDQRERVVAAFETLTEEAISNAREALSKTTAVFATATEIFEQNNVDVPVDMQPFNERKKVLRTELQESINTTRDQIGEAQNRLRNEQYRTAIEIARAQEARSEDILSSIYDVISGNAVIELSNLISRYEREGARVYAADELQRSNADLNNVRSLRENQEFQQASEVAASARANIELMEQRISGRAVEDIAEARSLLEDVADARTEKYSPELLVQVRGLINQAEEELQQERLKIALELADQAMTVSREALNKANRMAAEDAISDATTDIARAEAAGATLYAGREMESARQLIGQAQQLQRNNNYVEAEQLALNSSERAVAGLYKKVNDAEAAIADAKAVGGWEYDNSKLSVSSSNSRQALQLLESGQYKESQDLADSARKSALSVAESSRRNNYNTAVNRIQQNLSEGTQQGINYFQYGDSVEIRRALSSIQNGWSVENYDRTMSELSQLERRLRGTLDTTEEVVTTVADQQETRLEGLVNNGALDYASDLVASARENLKYARIDYDNGLYKSAHSNLDNAIDRINVIENRYQQETYADAVEALFKRYDEAQYRFRNVLSLDPSEIKALAFGSYSKGNLLAIAGQSTPGDFREDVEQIYAESLILNPPARMIDLHESVLEALNQGRIASIRFEKFLILNESSNQEAANLIDTAYRDVNRSNKIVRDLRRELFKDEVEFRLVTTSDLTKGNL